MQLQNKIILGALVLGLSLGFCPSYLHADETIEGKMVANHIGKVSSEITGERSIRVQELLVREGDRIKKGDVLARLSTEQLTADRTVALRFLEEAEATAGVAESNVAGAKLVFNRQAGLKKSDSFRRADFEDAEVALGATESELSKAQATVKRRKAEVQRIELEISLANIVAPYDGIVVKVLTNVGASVTQGNPHIVELLDSTRTEIEVEVPLNKLSHFQVGRELSYSVENSEKYQAKVRVILPKLSKKKKTRLIRLELKNGDVAPIYSDQQFVKVYLDNWAVIPKRK